MNTKISEKNLRKIVSPKFSLRLQLGFYDLLQWYTDVICKEDLSKVICRSEIERNKDKYRKK